MPAKLLTDKLPVRDLMVSAEAHLEEAIHELLDVCEKMGYDYKALWPRSDLDGKLEEARMLAAQSRNKLVEVAMELEK